MSENSSAKYYQKINKNCNNKLVKGISLSKEKKEKKQQYGCKQYNFQKMKNKSFLSIGKNIIK